MGVTGGAIAPTLPAFVVPGAVAGAALATGAISNAGNKTEETPSTPVASIIFRTFDSVATQLSCEFFFF